jgi:hypothetical protein
MLGAVCRKSRRPEMHNRLDKYERDPTSGQPRAQGSRSQATLLDNQEGKATAALRTENVYLRRPDYIR